MTDPRRYFLRMLAFLVVVAGVVGLLAPDLERAFTNNIGLNSVILAILLIGIGLDCREVLALRRDVAWVEQFRRGNAPSSTMTPRLLAPLATMLGDHQGRLHLTPQALRSLLDSLAGRLEEQRETSRYFTGLMVFLGLLGTFWGLSHTIGAIGDVIRGLTVVNDDVQTTFSHLRQGLDAPLLGMGTAFSSSMIGLAGSLILGFLNLQSGQAQAAFYNELEEWLSTQTKINSSSGPRGLIEATGEVGLPAYVEALLQQSAESMDQLHRTLARGEESRASTNTAMRQLADRLSTLADQMKLSQSLMLKLGEAQLEMRPLLQRLGDAPLNPQSGGLDEASRQHLRNMDLSLIRLVEETTLGREAMIREFHNEFRILSKILSARSDDDTPSAGGI